MENINRYIFDQEARKRYVKGFNDYMLRELYPTLHRADEYLNDEDNEGDNL